MKEKNLTKQKKKKEGKKMSRKGSNNNNNNKLKCQIKVRNYTDSIRTRVVY